MIHCPPLRSSLPYYLCVLQPFMSTKQSKRAKRGSGWGVVFSALRVISTKQSKQAKWGRESQSSGLSSITGVEGPAPAKSHATITREIHKPETTRHGQGSSVAGGSSSSIPSKADKKKKPPPKKRRRKRPHKSRGSSSTAGGSSSSTPGEADKKKKPRNLRPKPSIAHANKNKME